MSYEPAEIEDRWRRRWVEEGRYEVDPDSEADATFITVPYPYPSGGMHIGHARTYTVPDVYARYRRQQGDNVLFPIAWHVTGTPIIGAVERLKEGEQAQINSLQNAFGVPEADLADLETPMGYARYFIEEADCSYKTGMSQLGLSIDWRREFTTEDERYKQFISWQYETLREHGLLEKGLHPVNYCTNEKQPVTTHDLLEGEDAEFQEYTLIKFSDAEATYPMATLRPETVRGVTNAYVDPEATYVRATVDGETWIVSAAATEKLDLQAHDVTVEERFEGARLVGREVENPVTGDQLLILPADFVDVENATGVVMSVPAHSPDDYVALQDAKSRADDLADYGVDPERVRAIEPVSILDIEGYGEIPARDVVEEYGIDTQGDPALEEATQELYNREFHQGVLHDTYGEFGGEVIEDVRDVLDEHYRSQGAFASMYDFAEEVVCRCGGDVEVAEQETWFLRYNDEEWVRKVNLAIDQLETIPENTREQYYHTVDWLEEWPCIRNYGLGTPLPWDPEFIIEPLSDSTIYMAYYTIAHRLQDVPVEELDRDFFDALFYGSEAVEEAPEKALELREEFDYWYPVDYRCSAEDLISNHLTFFLYHHAELFEEAYWPGGITTMGMGLLEGEKMSSSKGHVILPGEAIDTYGADTVRFFLLNSSEPWQDFDWRDDLVSSTHDQLARFWRRAVELIDGPGGDPDELKDIDRWLLANLQETIESVTEALESFETRTASQEAFYRFEEHLRWYRRRTDQDRPGARWTLREVLKMRLRLLAPFVPFLANELHERLTGQPAEDAAWPTPADEYLDATVLAGEWLVEELTDDIADILEVTGEDPETIRIYTAANWKHEVFETAVETGPDHGAVMGRVMDNPDLRERGEAVNDIVGELVEFVRGYDDERLNALTAVDETAVYDQAVDFLEREFDAEVVVASEDADPVDPENKASQAVPFRPAIYVA